MATNGGPSSGIDWAALREFVARNEASEMRGEPATLTASQREAINVLVPPPQAPVLVQDKDFNWIGCLHEWLQKNGTSGKPVFSVDSVSASAAIYWRCTCQLPPTSKPSVQLNTFPCEGFGVDPGQLPPMFARKQDAKSFAARMACEYLDSRGFQLLPAALKPQPGLHPPETSPAPLGNAPSRQAAGQEEAEEALTSGSTDRPPQSAATAESTLGDAPSVTVRISDLAKQLGLPAPQFHVTQDPDLQGWNGQCDFQFNPRVPDGLGTAIHAPSQKAAKEMMAKAVLAWMLQEQEDRLGVKQKFIEE